MVEYEISCLKEGDYKMWDEFVDDSPYGTLFHKSYWLEASGKKFLIYGCFRDGHLAAGIPVICKSKFGFTYAGHAELTPYLGILYGPDQDSKYVSGICNQKKINRKISKRLKEAFSLVKIVFGPFSVDLQPFIWDGFITNVSYTYILKLDDLVTIWKNMGKERRNDISLAERNHIHVEASHDFSELFSLVEKTYQRRRRRLGFRSIAFKYDAVLRERNECNCFIAKNQSGDRMAGVYIVWDRRRAYYLLGGFDPDMSNARTGTTAIAMWEAIKFAKKSGLDEFDFEGSMVPGIEQFFREFGGRLTPYYSVSWRNWRMKLLSFTYDIQSGRSVFNRLRD